LIRIKNRRKYATAKKERKERKEKNKKSCKIKEKIESRIKSLDTTLIN